jgi:DNA-binding MltR family transcriptional regulator
MGLAETGNQISKSELKKMDLNVIIRKLYDHNLIDRTTFDKMNEVRQLRNDFQHNGLAFEYSSSQALDAEDKITKAIDCINVLKTNYESKIK